MLGGFSGSARDRKTWPQYEGTVKGVANQDTQILKIWDSYAWEDFEYWASKM